MKQSVVEFLVDNLNYYYSQKWNDIIKEAKEIEKQQIIDAYNSGQQIPPFDFAEQYYNEQFKKNKMKNIYVLATNQPSFLITYNSKLKLVNYPVITPSGNQYNVNITSNEEIKAGDYYIHNNKLMQSAGGEQEKNDYKNCKKIILTTDQYLIKNDVQAIDDEFLEWFVKNPSCEEVEVVKEDWGDKTYSYETIIPKEEPKQETLEEVAETELRKQNWDTTITLPFNGGFIEGFQQGAKWQQERSYSEEEVIQFGKFLTEFNNLDNEIECAIKKLLKQFKNK